MNLDLRGIVAVVSMEVGRTMIVKIHSDDDAEESTDGWHRFHQLHFRSCIRDSFRRPMIR
jgi:hypothetical protein